MSAYICKSNRWPVLNEIHHKMKMCHSVYWMNVYWRTECWMKVLETRMVILCHSVTCGKTFSTWMAWKNKTHLTAILFYPNNLCQDDFLYCNLVCTTHLSRFKESASPNNRLLKINFDSCHAETGTILKEKKTLGPW